MPAAREESRDDEHGLAFEEGAHEYRRGSRSFSISSIMTTVGELPQCAAVAPSSGQPRQDGVARRAAYSRSK